MSDHVSVPKDLEDLIPGFLENRKKDFGLLQGHIDKLEFNAIARIGHTMKGTCPGYGFVKFGRIGADLEMAAKKEDPVQCAALLKEFAAHLAALEVNYVGD